MKKAIIIFLIYATTGYSQTNAASLNGLLGQDSSVARYLLSLPDSSREAAYLAATYPQGFVRLGELQRNSANAFRNMAAAYSQNRQKQLWDLARYRELPALLIANKDKSRKVLKVLLAPYPEEIRKAGLFFARNYLTLIEMEQIRRDFEARSAALIRSFPSETQKAFSSLLNDPELFSLLVNNLATTITLGDMYKRDTALLRRYADSIRTRVAEEDRQEYQDWKAGISADSLVQKDLRAVSKKYAGSANDDIYVTGNGEDPRVIINILPYPYWAGYPHWYPYPYWHPYPWWYDLGFYWTPGGPFIFMGMPSYHFGWWYYGQPHYYRHYPHTSHYFDRHYQYHPRSGSGFNRSIRDHNGQRPAGTPRGNQGPRPGRGRR